MDKPLHKEVRMIVKIDGVRGDAASDLRNHVKSALIDAGIAVISVTSVPQPKGK